MISAARITLLDTLLVSAWAMALMVAWMAMLFRRKLDWIDWLITSAAAAPGLFWLMLRTGEPLAASLLIALAGGSVGAACVVYGTRLRVWIDMMPFRRVDQRRELLKGLLRRDSDKSGS